MIWQLDSLSRSRLTILLIRWYDEMSLMDLCDLFPTASFIRRGYIKYFVLFSITVQPITPETYENSSRVHRDDKVKKWGREVRNKERQSGEGIHLQREVGNGLIKDTFSFSCSFPFSAQGNIFSEQA